jgi:Family of unknown function (DUF5652)
MYSYFGDMIGQLGVPAWAFCILAAIFIWSYVWKLLALWKAATQKSVVWFIVLALVNTVGILDILYIYVFSKCCKKNSRMSHSRKRR